MISETPTRDIWDLLSLNIIPDHLQSTSGGYDFSGPKLEAMRIFLAQSRELFETATVASIIASPLLDFYCYSLLAKILVMKLDKRGAETLRHGHGLKFQLDASDPVSVETIRIVPTGAGTFSELTAAIPREYSFEHVADAAIPLRALLDLDIDVFDYTELESRAYPIHSFKLEKRADGQMVVEMRIVGEKTQTTIDAVRKFKPELELEGFHLFLEKFDIRAGAPIAKEFSNEASLPKFNVERSALDQFFIIPPLAVGDRKLQLFQHEIVYMILFAASNLVRYYPNQWNDLIHDEKRFWTLRKAISLARRSYPNYILNYISNEYHLVLPPGTRHRP